MLSNNDQFCTLQYAVSSFNKNNPDFKIKQIHLLHCAELNLLPLYFHCIENLRLEVCNEQVNQKIEIGIYEYDDIVEILEFKLPADITSEYFFIAKVKPLNIQLLKPQDFTCPIVTDEFLSAPYYFVPDFHIPEELNFDDSHFGYEGSIVEKANLILQIRDLPKIKYALECLKQHTHDNHNYLRLSEKDNLPALHSDAPLIIRLQEKNAPWKIPDPKDPSPEVPWYTPARYFARQLINDDSSLLTKRIILAKKIAQSLASIGIMKRGGMKPPHYTTILKALSNVDLG